MPAPAGNLPHTTREFAIEVPDDGATWSKAVTIRDNTADSSRYPVTAVSGRYVRLNVPPPWQRAGGLEPRPARAGLPTQRRFGGPHAACASQVNGMLAVALSWLSGIDDDMVYVNRNTRLSPTAGLQPVEYPVE